MENGSRNARSIHHQCQQGIFHSAFGPITDIWPGAGHSRGAHVGSHIQKIRQRNTAETPLVILIKKHHETKKKKKKRKNCARLYPAFASLTYLPFQKSGDVVGINTNYCRFGRNARFRIIKHPLPRQHIDTSIESLSGFNL